MADRPINLNKVRKARARAEKKARAAENVVRFGRSKAETKAASLEADRAARRLDGKRRDAPSNGADMGDEKP